MQTAEMSKLSEIIDSRSKKERIIGGEYIAFMGLLMIAVYAFNAFIYSEWWIWLIGIAIGWAGILIYDRIREKKEGKYTIRIQSEIYAIWIAIGGVALPLVLLFYGYFNLIEGKAVSPLMYLISSLGVWFMGVCAKSTVFKVGALACMIGTFLSIFYNSGIQQLVIFNSVMLAGFVVPGIVSKYNEQRG
jgi:hypothetical protein